MNVTRNEPLKQHDSELLEEMRAIRREQAALRRLLDSAIGVFLNSKFPYGRPVDRWRRGA
jgi:hypothetical protein